MQVNYNNIPTEMRPYRQWVCWRYEDREGDKPTKVPYNPATGRMASVKDVSDWVSFDEAVAAATAPGTSFDGIGFVLTIHDPYTIIDLDATDDPKVRERQNDVYQAFNSYTEYSPSGKGLHIIVRGSVPHGRRRSNVEMYPFDRFMTMTGNVLNDVPIDQQKQQLLEDVWEEMGRGDKGMYSIDSQPQTNSDTEVLTMALKAENGPKFKELLAGNWQHIYPSQSEADIAFVNIVTFYTQNIEQIKRIFWDSPLGQREKAKRPDYIGGMIFRAFDRMLQPINLIQAIKKVEKVFDTAPAVVQSVGTPDRDGVMKQLRALWEPQPITPPAGLMGDIAMYIESAAPRKVPQVAIAAAIGLMAGICGRAYNVSGTGLNQYIILLAKTGIGKEIMSRGISRIIAAVTTANSSGKIVPAAQHFIGPSDFASGQALLRTLNDPNRRCFISLIGEFGLKMQQLSDPRASSAERLFKKQLLDLYNKSGHGDVVEMVSYAKKEDNIERIPSPAVSILGEATPSTFYSAIDDKLITDGLLPRFTFIEHTGQRERLNKDHINAVLDPKMVQMVADLCSSCLNLMSQNMVHHVGSTKEAEQFTDEVEYLTTDLINLTEQDALRDLWNRAHIKTLKMAALQSVGMNYSNPEIDLYAAQWGFNVVMSDVLTIHNKFSRGEVGKNTEENQQNLAILRACVEYCRKDYNEMSSYNIDQKLHKSKIVPYSFLSRRIRKTALFMNDRLGATNALKRSVQSLVDAGDLQEVGKGVLHTEYDYSGRAFMLAQPDKLPDELYK